MDKCIIFGAGWRGKTSYLKLCMHYNVTAYTDNDRSLWGTEIYGVPVIPPSELRDKDAVVFICCDVHWREIAEQLDKMQLKYFVLNYYLSYEFIDQHLYPAAIQKSAPYKKENPADFSVLFVQYEICNRTNKLAYILKSHGVKTYSAFLSVPSKWDNNFDAQFPIYSYADFLAFLNHSDFDIVHCSNPHDQLVNICYRSNKAVVHDCHDIVSECYTDVSADALTLEYLANTKSPGCMYPTKEVKDIMARKYGEPQNSLVIPNLPIKRIMPEKKIQKRSKADGKIHVVYEGGMAFDAKLCSMRYYEPLFLSMARAGIQVHFYTFEPVEECLKLCGKHSNLFYEGNLFGADLIEAMTQYDLGLAVYNTNTDIADAYLDIASPNKVYEYLAAGLPVVTNINNIAALLRQYNCGMKIDMEGDIAAQLNKANEISIEPDFLEANKLLMDNYAEELLGFYKSILKVGKTG